MWLQGIGEKLQTQQRLLNDQTNQHEMEITLTKKCFQSNAVKDTRAICEDLEQSQTALNTNKLLVLSAQNDQTLF